MQRTDACRTPGKETTTAQAKKTRQGGCATEKERSRATREIQRTDACRTPGKRETQNRKKDSTTRNNKERNGERMPAERRRNEGEETQRRNKINLKQKRINTKKRKRRTQNSLQKRATSINGFLSRAGNQPENKEALHGGRMGVQVPETRCMRPRTGLMATDDLCRSQKLDQGFDPCER